MHGKFVYFWITPLNDLSKENGLMIYPVYLRDEYSNDSYTTCCDEDSVDFFTMTTATNFDFPQEYMHYKEVLFDIVRDNRVLIQTIKKIHMPCQLP